LLTAAAVHDLFVRNCVSLSGWNHFEVGRSTQVVFEHCVFVRSDIVSLAIGGGHDRHEVVVRSSIVTDNLARKAAVPSPRFPRTGHDVRASSSGLERNGGRS